jgi:hypothetical protein
MDALSWVGLARETRRIARDCGHGMATAMQQEPATRWIRLPTGRDDVASGYSASLPLWVLLTVTAALVFGIVARLVWLEDMEWKGDEIYTVETSLRISRTGQWPATGMGTSVGLPNPGLSVWAFTPLVAIDPRPTSVCRQVMVFSVLVMLAFAGMAIWSPESAGRFAGSIGSRRSLAPREAWLWGIALLAVNPYCVRIARKIWPPSLLGSLVLLLWAGRSLRSSRVGSLAWGLAGATIGQIHLSGFFLAGGIFIGSVVERVRGRDKVATRWSWWVAGSMIGAVGLFSWVEAIKSDQRQPPVLGLTPDSLRLRISLFWQYWLEMGLGLTSWATYTNDYGRFLSAPTLFARPTGLVGLLERGVYGLGVFGVVTWAASAVVWAVPQPRRRATQRSIVHIRRRLLARLHPARRPPIRMVWKVVSRLLFPRSDRPIGSDPEARFYAWASLLVGGGLLILACRIIHLHYLYIFSPFLFVWLALAFTARRRILALIVVAQAILTSASLIDLHVRDGAPSGDYGVSYRAQKP